MDNEKILEKEIDLIQNCITRMGQNSFSIKGWLIGLIIAIIALLPENVDTKIICLVIFGMTIIFWALDAFYLKTEKLYRWKYDWVIVNRKNSTDFCYDLNPYKKEMWLLDKDGRPKNEPLVLRIMFTKTLWPFYLPIILISIGVLYIDQLIQIWNCIAK